MKRALHVIILVSAFAISMLADALAHKSSDSYLSLHVGGPEIVGQWDIALRDLDYAIGLDGNNDGIITRGELRARHGSISDYMLSHLTLSADGQVCRTKTTDNLVDDHSDGAYAVLRFTANCGRRIKGLDVRYDFLFEFDYQHRGLLCLETGGQTFTTVFSPARKSWHMDGSSLDWIGSSSTISKKAFGIFGPTCLSLIVSDARGSILGLYLEQDPHAFSLLRLSG